MSARQRKVLVQGRRPAVAGASVPGMHCQQRRRDVSGAAYRCAAAVRRMLICGIL